MTGLRIILELDRNTGLSLRFQVAGEVASSHGRPPPHLQEVFEVQLIPFSKRHYRPKKAMFIKSTAIISGFMLIKLQDSETLK